jgi:uncharacterized protein (TIGR02391 family)
MSASLQLEAIGKDRVVQLAAQKLHTCVPRRYRIEEQQLTYTVMAIESSFDSRMWETVGKSYEERNYTAAILDSIQYLGDVVRDKTGLASDGMSLVGEAFGGSKPKLRVNRFETETDKNVQGGIEHLIRGLYKTFRNPRSHEKHIDSQEDANTVLLLVTYLLKVIGQAKSQFEKTSFLERVFDSEFVESDRYAELLAAEIPVKHQFDVLVDIYRKRDTGEAEKLRYIVKALWKIISEEAKSDFAAVVSIDLNTVARDSLQEIIELLDADIWSRCTDAARLRIESILIRSIKDGLYDEEKSECLSGALGTWATNIIHSAVLMSEFQTAVAERLDNADGRASDYIHRYILAPLLDAVSDPNYSLVGALVRGLGRGDQRLQDSLDFITWYEFDSEKDEFTEILSYPKWHSKLIDAYENFGELRPEPEDIPF